MQTQLNVGEVKALNSSPVAQKVFQDLASRQKHLHRSINIQSYADRLDMTEDEALEVFKGFEAKGLGSIVLGREGIAPTQFIPYYNLKSIGSAGMGNEIVIEAPAATPKRGRPKGSKNRHKKALSANPAGRLKKFDRALYMKQRWANGKMGKKKSTIDPAKELAQLLKRASVLLRKVA